MKAPRSCMWCGALFSPRTLQVMFCCTEHREEHHRKEARERGRRNRANAVKVPRARKSTASRGSWGCSFCADLPHRRPYDRPCRCGKEYSPREPIRASGEARCALGE